MTITNTEQWLMVFYISNQVLSAAVQALPQPDANSSKVYVFLQKFLSLLVADFKTFATKIQPPTEMSKSLTETKTVAVATVDTGVL